MKTYELSITINEGNDEFWESIDGDGCYEVTNCIRSILCEYGFQDNCIVSLKKYEES